MKWQNILGITGGSSVSVFFILALVLNLSGMSHSTPGDQVCTDCYDLIQVNSTYWEIKVEHAGPDKDIIFAKKTRSRTRWLNLDKIDEFIETNPKVFVEILVPTVKRFSTINHPEFGYLRPIKDGDSLIQRKSKKYNPQGDRFIIHGITNGQKVKWGFNLDDWAMDGIIFDPFWFPAETTVELFEMNANITTKWDTNRDVYFRNLTCGKWYDGNSSYAGCLQINYTEVTHHVQVTILKTWQVLKINNELINVTHDWHYWCYDNVTGIVCKDMWDGDGNLKIKKIKKGCDWTYFPYDNVKEKPYSVGRNSPKLLIEGKNKLSVAVMT